MKYCPYCGTGLPGVVSFCPECGEKLTDIGKTQKSKSEKTKTLDSGISQKSRKKEKRGRKKEIPAATDQDSYVEDLGQADDGYDGYYEDIRPVDENMQKEKMDTTLIWKVTGVLVGLLVIIGACVALMYVL